MDDAEAGLDEVNRLLAGAAELDGPDVLWDGAWDEGPVDTAPADAQSSAAMNGHQVADEVDVPAPIEVLAVPPIEAPPAEPAPAPDALGRLWDHLDGMVSASARLVNADVRIDAEAIPSMVDDLEQEIATWRREQGGGHLAPLETLEDFEREAPDPPADELVTGVLVRGGVNVLFGPSGSGKSWAAMDLALAATAGTGQFCGIEDAEVRQRVDGSRERVLWLYGAEDSRRRVKARLLALRAHHPLADPAAFGLRPCYDLDSPAGLHALQAAIAEHGATLVIVDTVSSATTLSLSDEQAVKPFLHALLRMAQETGATILLVHHTRKAGKERDHNPYSLDGMLGSVQWRNLCTGIVLVHGENGDIGVQGKGIDVLVVKSKDLDRPLPRAKVHWDHEHCRFVPGETPVEEQRNNRDAQQGAVLLVLLAKGPRNVSARAISGYGVPTSSSTRKRRIGELIERGYVEGSDAEGSAKTYSLTPKGEREATLLRQQEAAIDTHS